MTIDTFEQLAASRREWIETVLKPWCRRASLRDLRLAELEWENIAGRVDPDTTLWSWAWSRFPQLVHDEMPGIDESRELRVALKDGTQVTGYPDSRKSTQGRLVLLSKAAPDRYHESVPHAIDEIAAVEAVDVS